MLQRTNSHNSEERRGHIRFPLRLGARCEFHKPRGHFTIRRTGEVQNLSTRGCCLALTGPAHVEVGMVAKLWIDWPATLDDGAALQFAILGHVVRVEGHQVAATIDSYRFRVRRRSVALVGRSLYSPPPNPIGSYGQSRQ